MGAARRRKAPFPENAATTDRQRKHAVIFSADIFACQEIAMSCQPVRQTAKMQDLCFVTAYGSDLILT
jgi:hypothetical protein